MIHAMKRIIKGFHAPKGILLIAFSARPVPFIALPRAKPPATIQITDQSISCRSFAVMTLVMANTAIGSMATVFALMPNRFLPATHRKIVRIKVAATTTVRQLCETSPLMSSCIVF